jgi:uncharacterized protein (DUF1330 family)
MKTYYTVALAMVAGFGLGALAVQSLHAQAKPPVYVVSEINVSNPDVYAKEYVPKAQAIIKAAGGRYVAAGPSIAIEGTPPGSRVTILQWDSMEKVQAWRDSAEYKENRKIGDKYATFRFFAVAGSPN